MYCNDTCCHPERENLTVVITRQTRRARKAHRCTACGAAIAAGESYERIVFKDDEGFAATAQHVGGFCAIGY